MTFDKLAAACASGLLLFSTPTYSQTEDRSTERPNWSSSGGAPPTEKPVGSRWMIWPTARSMGSAPGVCYHRATKPRRTGPTQEEWRLGPTSDSLAG